MRQLSIEHRHDMTPGTEGARHTLDAGFAGEFCHHVPGDVIAKLRKDRELSSGSSWSLGFSLFSRSVAIATGKNRQLQPLPLNCYGPAVKLLIGNWIF